MDMELPHIELLNLSRSYILSRAIHTAAQLDIASHIGKNPEHVASLSNKTATNEDKLYRLLKYLCTYNIFQEYPEQHFALTPLAKTLKDGEDNCIRDVLLMVDETWWESAGKLTHCIKEDSSAFEHCHNASFFEYLSQSPQKQIQFDKGMAQLSNFDNAIIAKSYPFDKYPSIADIGSGYGGLSNAIHQRHPEQALCLFDSEQVLRKCQLSNDEFLMIPGNFFKTLPLNHSLYLYKGVLHDFNDQDVIEILTLTKKLSPQSSKILIIEQAYPDTKQPDPNKTMDMVMMILLNGKQRSHRQWQKLAEQAGFTLTDTLYTKSQFTIFELSH